MKLDGFALEPGSGSYRPLVPLSGGDLPVGILGLRLGLRPGSYLGEGGPWLRWLAQDGRVLPTNEERAADARQEVEQLEARLRAYEVRFGPING